MRPANHLISPRALVAILMIAASLVLMTSVQADQPLAADTYVVQAGDTLWAISAEVAEPGADVRQVISVVRSLNGLTGTVLQPGQTLLLPAG